MVSGTRSRTFRAARTVAVVAVISGLVLIQVGLGTAQASPGQKGTGPTQFNGVSCLSRTFCVAVGDQPSGSLVETWNGTSWTIQPTAVATDGFLNRVVCLSTRACVAVGYLGAYTYPLAEVWNGRDWKILEPSQPYGTYFLGVSCETIRSCIAVGAQPGGTLAELWNGSTWVTQATPNPKGAGDPYDQLEDVSCASGDVCQAVGQWQGYINGKGAVGATLAESFNGTAWTLESIPNPRGYGGGILHEESCVAADMCEAVGSKDDPHVLPVPLAEAWNGTAWEIQATPKSGTGSDTEVQGVSCSGARACTAVGYFYGGSVEETVALRWDGTAWDLQSPENPSYRNVLNGISCISARLCVAVGTQYPDSGAGSPLVETWNGSTWSTQTAPSV